MKIESINIDLESIKDEKERNKKDRMWFIEFWAKYIKTHSDKDWSKQQNNLINSQIESARWFYKNLAKTEEGREKMKMLIKHINSRENPKVVQLIINLSE